MSKQEPTIVLVHGAWHGSWCWQHVAPLLEERGLAVRTVDLPGVGATPGAGTDLTADAAAVAQAQESRRRGGPARCQGQPAALY